MYCTDPAYHIIKADMGSTVVPVTVISPFFFGLGKNNFLHQGSSNSPARLLIGYKTTLRIFYSKILSTTKNNYYLLNFGQKIVFSYYLYETKSLIISYIYSSIDRKKVYLGSTYDTPLLFSLGFLRVCNEHRLYRLYVLEDIIFWPRSEDLKNCTNRNRPY